MYPNSYASTNKMIPLQLLKDKLKFMVQTGHKFYTHKMSNLPLLPELQRFNLAGFYNTLLNVSRNFQFAVVDERGAGDQTSWTTANQSLVSSLSYQQSSFRTLQAAVQSAPFTGVKYLFIKSNVNAGVVASSYGFPGITIVTWYGGSGPISTNTLTVDAGSYRFFGGTSMVNINFNFIGGQLSLEGDMSFYSTNLYTERTIRVGTSRNPRIIINTSTVNASTLFAASLFNNTSIRFVIAESTISCDTIVRILNGANANIGINVNNSTIRGNLTINPFSSVSVGRVVNNSTIQSNLVSPALITDNTNTTTTYLGYIEKLDLLTLKKNDKYALLDSQAEILSNSSITQPIVEIDKDYIIKPTDNTVVVLGDKHVTITILKEQDPGRRYIIHKFSRVAHVTVESTIPIDGKVNFTIPRKIASIVLALNTSKTMWYIVNSSQHIS